MGSRRIRWNILLLLVAALGWGSPSEAATNVWGQRWDIPYENNTIGAHLGAWPTKGLDLYAQWVTPQILAEGHVAVDDKATLNRIASLLEKYIVVRVWAINNRSDISHPFDYNSWALLIGGRIDKPVVLTGGRPTIEGGYFVGSTPPHSTLSGWVFFPRGQPTTGPAIITYDFGYQRVTFTFSPHHGR